MTKGMNRVHRQRIANAVEAANAGAQVVLSIGCNALGNGFAAAGARLICSVNGRVQVIASGGKLAMEEMLPQAQYEFRRQLEDLRVCGPGEGRSADEVPGLLLQS